MDKGFRIRLGVVFLFVFVLGLGVLGRASYLMLVPSQRLRQALDRQFHNELPKLPRRGNILDRNSEPIAVSVKVKSLYANPNKVERRGEAAYLLSRVINLSSDQIRTKLKTNKGFVWLKRHLTDEEAQAIEHLMTRKPFLHLGFGLAEESKRFYPDQNLAAQIVGFVGMDDEGLEGIELFYNNELHGKSGETKAEDGKTLVLTIDKAIQYTLQSEIEEGVKSAKALSGSGIVMNADTGDIVAMASYPSYNLNHFRAASPEHRRNKIVTDTYEPGSTMKPILVAGSLFHSVITPETKVFCEYGKMQVGGHWIREAETKDRWGWLKVDEVIQRSSNVGATKIGFLIGAMHLANFYKKMGMAQKTGVDLPGEASGYLPDYKSWSKIMLSNISFGQGLSVTPLQIVRAYAAFANGGYLVKPRIVRQIGNFEGEIEKEIPVSTPVRVMETAFAEKLIHMMSKVATDEGTAPKAAIPGFEIVGKTGTAQKAYPGIGYKSGKHVSSFVGFVKDVKPKMVALILIDEPKYPYYGGETAAPVFRKVMSAALARDGVKPLLPISAPVMAEKKPKPEVIKMSAAAPKIAALEQGDSKMPNLIGASARDVMQLFNRREVNLKLRGGGVVVEQFPAAGAEFRKGETISVRLSHGEDLP